MQQYQTMLCTRVVLAVLVDVVLEDVDVEDENED